MNFLLVLPTFVRAWFFNRIALAAENLALRQQLAVYERTRPKPKLQPHDRLFWVLFRAVWKDWRRALAIVEPDTVCRWHRAGFRLFWKWKSRHGRPAKSPEVRQLIRRLHADNPLWGSPRLRSELRLLGHHVSEATIRKYLPVPPRGPRKSGSQSWRTFWKNHLHEVAAVDFDNVLIVAHK